MSILSKLKFSDAKRSASVSVADPRARLRQKLNAAIDMQIGYAKSDSAGTKIERTVFRYRGEGEDRKKVEEPARVRRWYFMSGGTWHTEVRYGTSVIPISGKHTIIEAGDTLESVVGIYDLLKKAVDAGELDKQLAVAGVRKRAKAELAAEEGTEAVVAPRFKKTTVRR